MVVEMKKIIPIIAIFLLMLVSCQQSGKVSVQDTKLQLKERLDSAEWNTFVDKTYQVGVIYPDFFKADTTEAGTARFYYLDGNEKAVCLTMFVEPNVEGWNIERATLELTDSCSTCLEKGKDYFIMEGTFKEDPNCLFFEKCYLIGDKWVDLAVYYRVRYRDDIGKLFEIIKCWNPNK